MGQASKRAAQLKPFCHLEMMKYSPPLAQVSDPTTNTELLVKQLAYDSSRCSVSDLQQLLQRKMMLQHQNIAALRDYYVDQGGQGPMSQTTTAVLLYNFPFGTLESQKVQRVLADQPYRENELWSVLKAIVLGFSYLQRNGIKHECVRLSTIYISQSGSIKVSDPQITRLDTNYEIFERDRTARVPLSPKELQSALKNMPNIVYDPFKSDVFCAGMVILQLINLRDQMPAPGSPSYNSYISKGLTVCSSKFSSELTEVLKLMLQQEEQKRLDWNELQKLIDSCQQRRKSHDCTSSIKTAIFPQQEVVTTATASIQKPSPIIANLPKVPVLEIKQEQFPSWPQETKVEIVRTRSPFSQSSASSSYQQRNDGKPPLSKPLSTRQPPTHNAITPSIESQPRLPPPPTPGTRLNHSISESLKAAALSQPNPIIKSNRIMASNINRERSLGRVEGSPLDSGHSSFHSNTNPAKQSTISVTSVSSSRGLSGASSTGFTGFTGIPPISFSFQSAKTVKPLTCAPTPTNFQSIREESKQAMSSKVVERLGNQTPVHSIIVNDRAAFQRMGSNDDQLGIIPRTIKNQTPNSKKQEQQKNAQPQMQPSLQDRGILQQQQSQYSFDKKLHTVRSFKDLKKSQPIIEVLPLNPPPDIKPELLRLIPDKNISSTIHEPSSIISTSNQMSILLERIPVNISEIKYPPKIESKLLAEVDLKEQSEPAQKKFEFPQEKPQMAASLGSSDWSTLFRKNQSSKISVQIQTSPKKSVSPARKTNSPAKARISEGNDLKKFMDASSRTVSVRHQPIKIQPKYEGNTLRGFRHGYGKYTFEDGGYYEGEWAFNRMQGNGKLYYASGKLAYDGDWSQDQIHGYGTLFNQNPRYIDTFDYKDFSKVGNYWSTYEGSFEFDMKNGNGTLTLCNGQTYSGHFEADKVHGQGIFRGRNRVVHGLWDRDLIRSIL